MSERVREVLLREIRLIHANLRAAPDNKQEEVIRLSPQTVLHSLGVIDRIAMAVGGKGRRLAREMREVRALVAKDLHLEREWSSDGKPAAVIHTAAS